MEDFRLIVVGPEPGNRCGITDYIYRLLPALEAQASVVYRNYSEALEEVKTGRYAALLVHYERSLVPNPNTLRVLGNSHPGMFVVPHEVYEEDPFAFRRSELKPIPGLFWAQKGFYRWRHRAYSQEVDLQNQGYYARGIFPLNQPAFDILNKRHLGALCSPIHLASFPPLKPPSPPELRNSLFPNSHPQRILGIFGFLTATNDYGMVLDTLTLNENMALLVLGGERLRQGLEARFQAEVRIRGLSERVILTGFIPEEELHAYLMVPDAFVFPARFKSSSGSLLRLFHLGKTIFATDLPLTRDVAKQGGPLHLFRNPKEFQALIQQWRKGSLALSPNNYPYTLEFVAQAYVKAMCQSLA